MSGTAIEWTPSSVTFVTGTDGNIVRSRIRSVAEALIAFEGASGASCKLTNLANPTTALDAANKAYVDSLFQSGNWGGGGSGLSFEQALADTSDSTSPSTGSIVLQGGMGIAKNLQVGSIVTATAFAATSDARLKTRVVDARDAADRLKKVHARKYEFHSEPGRVRFGVLAQDLVAAGLGASVFEVGGRYAVDYNALCALLLERVNVLEDRLQLLEGP
jgi:hypothetical protein